MRNDKNNSMRLDCFRAVSAPSPDYREAKGVIANFVEALTKVVPPRMVALSSMGAHRTSGVGNVSALSL